MIRPYHLFILAFILICLSGTIFAQTFQYSRGWTNGKKRSSHESFVMQDGIDNTEVYGICQMERLKEIWANRNLDDEYLPCQFMDKSEMAMLDGHRRKSGCNRNSVLDSFPHKPN